MSSSQQAGSPKRHPVFLHVGEAKTGTTYLQNLLDSDRDELRAAGLLYPPCGGNGHVPATLDLRKAKFKGVADPAVPGSWGRLVTQIREWDGPALVSSELLAPARPAHIERAMASLDFADVHIILTVRDLARQLPAAWQERVKNRGQESFAEWLATIHDPKGGDPGGLFWALHDVERILEKWSANLPPKRVHVITVPPAGGDRSLLWKRFAQVIGVDPERFRQPPASVNASLGAAEVNLVRQVNIALGGDDFPWPHYDRFMKWYLSPQLAKRRGVPIELPEPEYAWAVQRSQQMAKAIADAGYDVVGDLDELIPTSRPTGMDPDLVPGELIGDAGVAGITSLVELLARTNDDMNRLRQQMTHAKSRLQEHQDLPPGERTKRFLVELSGQIGWLGRARRGYTKVRRRRTAQAGRPNGS